LTNFVVGKKQLHRRLAKKPADIKSLLTVQTADPPGDTASTHSADALPLLNCKVS